MGDGLTPPLPLALSLASEPLVGVVEDVGAALCRAHPSGLLGGCRPAYVGHIPVHGRRREAQPVVVLDGEEPDIGRDPIARVVPGQPDNVDPVGKAPATRGDGGDLGGVGADHRSRGVGPRPGDHLPKVACGSSAAVVGHRDERGGIETDDRLAAATDDGSLGDLNRCEGH